MTILYIMTTKGPTVLKPLQKNRKYGAVVSMIMTATTSSISSSQARRNTGTESIRMQENRNITLEGAVICKKFDRVTAAGGM